MKVQEIIGHSAGGKPIEARKLTTGGAALLLIGGVHGDEPEGYYLVERYLSEELWKGLEGKAELWVIPRLNPDGCTSRQRGNSHGVDLNRNMPTKDWSPLVAKPRYNPGPSASSEPETRALVAFIEKIKPHVIVSVHSWEPMINYNGPCKKLAEHMAKFNQLRVSDDIGYPTPGSLGTWAGWERQIPTITLEIRHESSETEVWETHAQALRETLEFAAANKVLG